MCTVYVNAGDVRQFEALHREFMRSQKNPDAFLEALGLARGGPHVSGYYNYLRMPESIVPFLEQRGFAHMVG